MNKLVTRKGSRFLAVMLLVVLFLVVFLLVEPLWVRYAENSQQIASLNERLMRFQRLSSRREGMKDNLEKLLKDYQSRGYLLKGETPGLAVADLQSIVRKMIEQADGRLISTQVIGNQADNDQSVKLRVKVEGDITECKNILEAIETSTTVLLLNNVTILKSRRKRFKVQGGFKPLQLNFDLIAFYSGRQT